MFPSAKDTTKFLVKHGLVPRPKGRRHRRAADDTATNEAFEELDSDLVDPTADIPSVSCRGYIFSTINLVTKKTGSH